MVEEIFDSDPIASRRAERACCTGELRGDLADALLLWQVDPTEGRRLEQATDASV